MFKITGSFLLFILTLSPSVRAMSLGPFIIFRDKEARNNIRTNAHEMVHFFQQLEMLFVLMWILYILFYVVARISGKNHRDAYRSIPFEREAYENEENIQYVITRKSYAWIKYIRK